MADQNLIDQVLIAQGANAGADNALTDKDLTDQFWGHVQGSEKLGQGPMGGEVRSQVLTSQLLPLIAMQKQRNAERAKTNLQNEQQAIGQQKTRMVNQFGDQAKRGLAEDLAGVKRGANSRGLLYSGLRRGAEQDLKGQSASQVAGYEQKVNTAGADKLADYSKEQAQRGLTEYGMQNTRNIGDYQAAVEGRNQRKQQSGQIGGALGMLGGAVLGGL